MDWIIDRKTRQGGGFRNWFGFGFSLFELRREERNTREGGGPWGGGEAKNPLSSEIFFFFFLGMSGSVITFLSTCRPWVGECAYDFAWTDECGLCVIVQTALCTCYFLS